MTIAAQYYGSRQSGKDDTVHAMAMADKLISLPSPEEGRRLIQAFLAIKKPDLREEIFNFVTAMLKVQEER
jgi:hypothetical protein